jgi:cobalt/nickel transport system permease protein
MTRHLIDADPHADLRSPLHRWDPRAKLIALGLLIVVQACLTHLPTAAAGAALGLAILAASRLPLGFCVRRMAIFGAFVAPFLLLLPVLGGGDVVWRAGPVVVYREGSADAVLIGLRALGVISMTVALFYSARQTDTLWAAQSLGVPRALVQLALITLRYVPFLGDAFVTTRTAAVCRGFQPRASGHTYRTTAHVAGAVLIRGHERANRVWQAMACRGFVGRLYPVRAWRLGAGHVWPAVACVAAAGGLLAWDRWVWLIGH